MASDLQTRQYLTFVLGDEVFALNISNVREIIQNATVTVVPLMPNFVRGVINLRGAVVPVIDLQRRFGRDITKVGKKTCTVIFDVESESEKLELGILVDAVREVIDITPGQIEMTPHFGTTIERDFIHAMAKVDGMFIPILDTHKALNIDDMAKMSESHGVS
jgi:purine-binding chemotaxis protein CheW